MPVQKYTKLFKYKGYGQKTSWKHPGTGVTQAFEFGEKVALVHFESFSIAHDMMHHKNLILTFVGQCRPLVSAHAPPAYNMHMEYYALGSSSLVFSTSNQV
jgi:hypothetical protein